MSFLIGTKEHKNIVSLIFFFTPKLYIEAFMDRLQFHFDLVIIKNAPLDCNFLMAKVKLTGFYK